MSSEFLDQVKDQLATRSTRTTLEALQQRGMQKVRVIRSSQILQLIEEAVDRALEERGLVAGAEERGEVLAASQEIFKDMVQEESKKDRALLEEYRGRQEGFEQEIKGMKSELAEREVATKNAEARAAELNAELQMLQKRQDSAFTPETLLDELRSLRQEIAEKPAAAAAAAPAPAAASAELQSQIADLGAQLGQEMERIGKKVGLSSAKEIDADFTALFNNQEELESNLEGVKAEEHKGGDVSAALARMKALRGGGKADKKD